MINPAGARVIDTNAMVESKLQEISQKMHSEYGNDAGFTDGFMQGLDAMQVAELVGEDGMIMYDGPQQPLSPEQLIEQAQEEINAMKKEAMAEIDRARLDVIERAKQEGYELGLQEGKEEGFRQGHQDGLDSVEDERKKMLMEVSVKAAMIEEEYHKKLDELEPFFVETITEVYEHVFGVSLKDSKAIVVHLIRNTMRNLEGNNGYLVHVSKEDYPFVSMQKKDIINGTSISLDAVDIIEDATLGASECMIETGNGVFDCGLGTQLEALNEELRLLSYSPKKADEQQ